MGRALCGAEVGTRMMHASPNVPTHPLRVPTHMAAPALSDIEIQRALGHLPGWSRRSNVISKTFTLPTFPSGIAFVRRYSGGPDIHAACGMLASTARGGTTA